MNHDADDEAQLVEAAQRGDAAAQGELLQRHLPSLRAFLRARGGAEFRAREGDSDLVQSACVVALQNLEAFEWRGGGSFRAWFCVLVENVMRNHRHFHRAERRDVRRELAPTTEADVRLSQAYASIATPSCYAAARETVLRLEAALDQLPAEHRDVVIWSRLVGLPHREIAVRLGKSEVAVRTILSRALVRLAAMLDAG